MARAVGRRSRCTRAQIGCVIVDRHQRVLATSYNGPPGNYVVTSEECREFCARGRNGPNAQTVDSYSDCVANHAEINGLLMTDRTDREGGAIYVTGHVCFGCAKAIANSGLSDVYLVDADDEEEAYRRPERSIRFLEMCRVGVTRL